MKSELLKLYKKIGETPLECIERFRLDNPEYKDIKMTYLGRLDPMAEGLLMVLAGDTREKEKYLTLDKTYEFEVLWGLATDTYDILGLVTNTGPTPTKLDFKMESLLEDIKSKKTQKYPPFSSKVFNRSFLGVRGGVEEVDLPTREIKIFDIKHLDTQLVTIGDISNVINERIDLVNGDFRQKDIRKKWKQELGIKNQEKFLISKFIADVSSGTYIRSLAHEMGQKLGTAALAYSIKRTRVGEYKL